ncbi:MAG TPA: alpha/beta hydrolase-fold protein [bacterium]|nr:alpha/beta hydrolase-fold protein [bacterium]
MPTTESPRAARLAIRELERRLPLRPEDVDAFLKKHDFPLAEGTSVTFVHRGMADAVMLRHWVYGLPSSQPFRRIPGTDLWYLILELPAGSRVEYKLEVVRGPHHQWIADPLNPHRARDPFGANSICQATGYEIPEWTQEDPAARAGRIEEMSVPGSGGDHPIRVYLPARYRESRRYPLLVVHDGTDYERYASLKIVLDNLIHRLEIPSMVVALTDPGNRMEEYVDSEGHARFLVEELVPHLEKELPLRARPGGRGLMGASLGAVATLSTAARYPGFFGRLLLQSGSFAFSDIGLQERGPAFDPVADFVNGYRDDPVRVAERVFLSCGTHESLIYENRSLVPLLQATGMDVRYEEARDGHHWENWRDRLRTGLSWLFPGPLWMVYE